MRVHQRISERGIELQLDRLIGRSRDVQEAEGAFQMFAIFIEKAQMEPEWRRSRRDRCADGGVAAAAVAPSQGRAHIIDLSGAGVQAIGVALRLRVRRRLSPGAAQLGVAPFDFAALIAVIQFLERVGPRSVEQPVQYLPAGPLNREQRLRRKVGEDFGHLDFVDSAVGGHGGGAARAEGTGEHGEPAQHHGLDRGQDLIAPIQRGPHGSMARRCGAPAPRQQAQAVVEARRQTADSEQINSCSREFDRQRQTVESAADIDHGRNVRIAKLERIQNRHGSFDEQTNRWKIEGLGGAERRSGAPGLSSGARQSTHSSRVRSGSRAGRQNMDVRRAGQGAAPSETAAESMTCSQLSSTISMRLCLRC